VGLYQGFSLATKELKSRLEEMALCDEGLFLLGAGSRSFRMRPNLSVTETEIDLFLEILERCLIKL
jgi:4-aminobutyrate aminotransferase-like enzyme